MCNRRIIIKTLICLIILSVTAYAQENIELGNQLFGQGNFNKAIEYYQRSIEDKPTFAAYVNLGHCYMQLEQWGDAAIAYEEAIRLKPDEIESQIWHSLGQAYFRSCKYEQAIDAFTQASRIEPLNNLNDIWIARCMIELKQWIQAESILTELLQSDFTNTTTLELLAYVYNQQSNWLRVINIYKQLIGIDPQNSAYRITLANVLMNQGQKQQAVQILEFVRRVDISTNLEIDRKLADFYLSENMPKEAAIYYNRIVTSETIPSSEDYYRLGLAYYKAGELLSCEQTFEKMKKANPDDFKPDLYLGHVNSQSGRLDKALLHYRTALDKNTESGEVLVALADLQMQNEHYAQAAANLAKAISLGDNRAQIYYNYILALIKEKDEINTISAFKRALAEYPYDKQLRDLLDQYIKETVLNSSS